MLYRPVGQEGRAIARYEWLANFLRQNSPVPASVYEAKMFETFGVRPRTTAQYIKHMLSLEYIEIKGDLVEWKETQ